MHPVDAPVIVEALEPAKHDGHELGLGENFKNGMVGCTGVAEVRLVASPIKEFEMGEHICIAGGAMSKDPEDKFLGEGEGEAGERSFSSVGLMAGEDFENFIKDGEFEGPEPLVEGGGNVFGIDIEDGVRCGGDRGRPQKEGRGKRGERTVDDDLGEEG